MCILCVIQKWSRRVATMLPWLVIPLIGLWALSQLLPPAFRFEITSPRLACLLVLCITLVWYELLMPWLSAWRVRRNARLRDRKRFEAIELQKLRKTATRRCRNCLTPYRDQNPGGGRFMCSYCGHISKRPVLDLPRAARLGISSSGIIKDLVGKGGKILNGKGWTESGWMCGQDWLENGGCSAGSIPGKSSYWRKDGSSIYVGDEHCLTENSYSGVVLFARKLLTYVFFSIRWLWTKIFRISSSMDGSSSGAEQRGMLAKRGENGANFPESRVEKSRRKAEEKRQARLEKELLEQEERNQREEVARLVEERRRLRDEKMEAEKDRSKSSIPVKEKDSKKEVERKRQEKRKEKDKSSSKSNSDVEEVEKRASKETERKRDLDKKSETDRKEQQRFGTESSKTHNMETGHVHGLKISSANNISRGNTGTRYLDRMRGTFLSSSKAFSGGSFFGRGANQPVTVTKENKSNSSIDHGQNSAHRRDFFPPERVAGKSVINGEDKNISRPVLFESQTRTSPKKSWQQLFACSSTAPVASNGNVISRPNSRPQPDVQSPQLIGQPPSMQPYPVNFGVPSPFTLCSYTNESQSSSLGFSPAIEPIFPIVREKNHELIPEEPELFEDPCYIPDPVSLLGPVSESLDNFQLDRGAGFGKTMGLERPHTHKISSGSSEACKLSPIESPLSRLRGSDEKQSSSNLSPSMPKGQEFHAFPVDDANETGTWQMWSSSSIVQNGLSLIGGSASWLSDQSRSNKEDFVQHCPQKTMASLFSKEDLVLPATHYPHKGFLDNGQNVGAFSTVSSSTDRDPWLQSALSPLFSSNSNYSCKPQDEGTKKDMIYGSLIGSATDHKFELPPPANRWSSNEWIAHGSSEGVGKHSVVGHPVGSLFPKSDVQSLWSFE